jgi:hypothetical protein
MPELEVVGKNVFIRTVTYHYTGRLVSLDPSWITLEDAAWIADTGVRLAEALVTGIKDLSEVEPYPPGPVYIATGAVVDICEWHAELPRAQK